MCTTKYYLGLGFAIVIQMHASWGVSTGRDNDKRVRNKALRVVSVTNSDGVGHSSSGRKGATLPLPSLL